MSLFQTSFLALVLFQRFDLSFLNTEFLFSFYLKFDARITCSKLFKLSL